MPDQYRVKIVPAAHHDLEEIDDFISVNSPQNAKSVTTELYTEIESLSIFPHRYKIYEDNHDASEIVHSMPVAPFVVFYRIIESAKLVEILTVRHGARDRPAKFFR